MCPQIKIVNILSIRVKIEIMAHENDLTKVLGENDGVKIVSSLTLPLSLELQLI